MSDPYVYVSRSPEVVEAWKAAEAELNDYRRRTEAVLDEAGVGDRKVWRSTGSWSWGKFCGIDVPAGEKVPAGWRMGSQCAVPDNRTKAGKKITAAMKVIRHPGDPLLKLQGMPADVCTGGGFISPAARLLENRTALYLVWKIDPATCRESFTSPSAEIDAALWQRAKLSDYYAATEARLASEGLSEVPS